MDIEAFERVEQLLRVGFELIGEVVVAVMDGLVKIAAVGIHGPAVLPHANLNAVVAPFPYAAADKFFITVYFRFI